MVVFGKDFVTVFERLQMFTCVGLTTMGLSRCVPNLNLHKNNHKFQHFLSALADFVHSHVFFCCVALHFGMTVFISPPPSTTHGEMDLVGRSQNMLFPSLLNTG